MSAGIIYKYGKFLSQADDEKFDKIHKPGDATPYSGIYRCEGCGDAVTSVSPHPLPPETHHTHSTEQGKIRWRLAVWG